MKAQELLDKVVIHLVRQGERSIVADLCLYRSPNGAKCAIGALIPDDLYHPSMEACSVSTLTRRFGALAACLTCEDLTPEQNAMLLSRLQILHDEKYHWNLEARSVGPYFWVWLKDHVCPVVDPPLTLDNIERILAADCNEDPGEAPDNYQDCNNSPCTCGIDDASKQ